MDVLLQVIAAGHYGINQMAAFACKTRLQEHIGSEPDDDVGDGLVDGNEGDECVENEVDQPFSR